MRSSSELVQPEGNGDGEANDACGMTTMDAKAARRAAITTASDE
jgi:hypothetical protein